eukprot:CAMPEP_0184697332 /NCGR_PEP_ID=MMETSP0313-20130426/4327_1 /TAXON_ID=2792 /ORGANISM="Porphyridium aerugineum, Strain SAG 1380-2" /LENGTH=414 /DNA_ID=CAMNT_0027156111 /DNA_START=323 /DNA_END=1567 /DNA_ORIENTATION=+
MSNYQSLLFVPVTAGYIQSSGATSISTFNKGMTSVSIPRHKHTKATRRKGAVTVRFAGRKDAGTEAERPRSRPDGSRPLPKKIGDWEEEQEEEEGNIEADPEYGEDIDSGVTMISDDTSQLNLDEVDVALFDSALNENFDVLQRFDDLELQPSEMTTMTDTDGQTAEEMRKSLLAENGQGEQSALNASINGPSEEMLTPKMFSEEFRPQEEDQKALLEPRWYFIHVRYACEMAVKTSLENMVNNDPHVGEHLKNIVVPTKPVLKYNKRAHATQKNELIFPGYVLVYMSMTKQCYNEITQVPHVQYFVGDPNREKLTQSSDGFRPPTPLSPEEVTQIFNKVQNANMAPELVVSFQPGDIVEVKDGPFKGTEGRVCEVDNDKGTVQVNLIVFGKARSTASEFQFKSVMKKVFEEGD